MSQSMPTDEEKGNGQYNHPRGKSQSSPGDYADDSGDLFSMYSKMAAEEDLWMAERWQKDADSILVFTGLFSAAVAALLSVSIPDIKQNPQDTSNFYLRNIALSNSSNAQPPPFSAPTEAVVVNLLFFSSLAISLSCAILATLVQQWARQYVRYTQPPQRSPKTRARIRAMFSHSVDRSLIKCIGSLLPCYLHLAILFFLVGLLVYLYYLNRIIFFPALFLFMYSIAVYGFFTFLPLFQHNSLLYTPISTFPISLLAALSCLYFIVFRRRFFYNGWGNFDWAFEDVGQKAEEIANSKPEADVHVLDWSLRSLSDDDAVEKYLRAIPDFFGSTNLGSLSNERKEKLKETKEKLKQTIRGLLGRTFSSNTVTEDVTNSRLIVCLDASHSAREREDTDTSQILEDIREGKWPKLLQSVEMGHSLIRWGNNSDESYKPLIRSVVSSITPHTASDPLSTPSSDITAVGASRQGFFTPSR